MPPVIIFKSTAKDPKKRKVRPRWMKDLPKVVRQWAVFDEIKSCEDFEWGGSIIELFHGIIMDYLCWDCVISGIIWEMWLVADRSLMMKVRRVYPWTTRGAF